MNEELLNNLRVFSPELVVVATLILMFVVDAFCKASVKNKVQILVVVLGLTVAGSLTCCLSKMEPTSAFSGMIRTDGFLHFFRIFFFAVTGLAAFFVFGTKEIDRTDSSEYLILIVAVLFGLTTMVASTNFLMLYLSLETVSIISFVLAGFDRKSVRSNEASIKYLIFGGVSSALMLYGLSILYGLSGTLDYAVFAKFVSSDLTQVPMIFNAALILVFAGFAYKISAFPMHFWTPDVYEGAPTPVVAFFSVAPKAAGIGALIRFVSVCFASTGDDGQWVIGSQIPILPAFALIAAITMIVGNLSAIGLKNVKRILAYSSIAHVGYLLMGLAVFSKDGMTAILFYLVIYCFMNVGAFWVVSIVKEQTGSDDLNGFAGVGLLNPFLGTVMAIFLFSLTGIPLFSGFIGKFLLFGSVFKGGQGLVWLAVIGVLNSVVSLFYYASILKALWFEKPTKITENFPACVSKFNTACLLALAIATVVLGLFWSPLFYWVSQSIIGLVR